MNRILKLSIEFILLCFCSIDSFAQKSLNLDFELREYGTSLPKNWYIGGEGFSILLDSLEKYTGKFSLKMEMLLTQGDKFGVFSRKFLIDTFAGKDVEFRGWIKTKAVKNGYAGLWLMVNGVDNKVLDADNMYDRGLEGDNDWTQISIKMDVNQDAESIVLGGLFPGKGTVWFDNLELYVNGEKYIDIVEPEPKTTLSQKEIATLKKYIYPLRTCEPDSNDTKDLKVLDKLISSSKVLALGEVSHGSSEIFKLKNRIIQYLAANNGFDIFSIEANMPESYKLNEYTIRGEGDPKKLIASMYFWTWNTKEILNMVEWMRTFNQPKQRVLFTGFDMQQYEGAINELFDAFKGNEAIKNKIIALKKQLDETIVRAQKKQGSMMLGYDQVKEIDSILSFLQHSIEISSFQVSEKDWLQQNIVIILQYLRENNYTWRDQCMADNFMWIKGHHPDSRFIIWAHNGHIMKTMNESRNILLKAMGNYLAEKLTDNYVTFGFTFFDGSYTAVGSKGLTAYKAVPADPGTLEYLLNQLDEPIFILDLKKIKSDKNAATEWLLEQMPYRGVGSVGGLGYQGEFREGKISDDFDYLIFIKTSSPSHLL